MRISIVVYDTSAIDRIKINTYKFFSENGNVKESGNIIWAGDICMEFQKRLIILNFIQEKCDVYIEIENYLGKVLKDEEIAINYGKYTEYSAQYGKPSKLLVAYI